MVPSRRFVLRVGLMKSPPRVPADVELSVLFEEYRALYGLATLRMTALDKRMPITAGAMAAVVSGLDVASPDSQLMLLIATPLALVWFARATVNHARSFEDALRRIEEIEGAVNDIAGKPILRFQSRHPSRGRSVGGRTGRESVSAVLASSILLLAATGWRMRRAALLSSEAEIAYFALLGAVGVYVLLEGLRLSRYQYAPTLNARDLDP